MLLLDAEDTDDFGNEEIGGAVYGTDDLGAEGTGWFWAEDFGSNFETGGFDEVEVGDKPFLSSDQKKGIHYCMETN